MAVPMRGGANVDNVLAVLCMALVSRLAVPLDNADGGRVDVGRADASPLKINSFGHIATSRHSQKTISVSPDRSTWPWASIGSVCVNHCHIFMLTTSGNRPLQLLRLIHSPLALLLNF